MDKLETEIATALTSSETTSAALKKLVEQVTVAAQVADEEATKARGRALDPTRTINVEAVSSAVVAAELRRDRLRAAIPSLQQRLIKVEASEEYRIWAANYEAVKGRRDAAATELRMLYAPFVVRMADLLYEIEAIDGEIRRINSAKPMQAAEANRDGLFLHATETYARGGGERNSETSIIRDLRLPNWHGADGLAWPPHRLALQFKLSELEQRQIDQQREAIRQRARAIAGEVERQQAAE